MTMAEPEQISEEIDLRQPAHGRSAIMILRLAAIRDSRCDLLAATCMPEHSAQRRATLHAARSARLQPRPLQRAARTGAPRRREPAGDCNQRRRVPGAINARATMRVYILELRAMH